MGKEIAPSARKAQGPEALLRGALGAENGEELLSPPVRLSTGRVPQEALAGEQARALGRERYERQAGGRGYRNGDESGAVKTAEGMLRGEVAQRRGGQEPYRSARWSQVAKTSEVLERVIVGM
jgi:hypothetical protein